MDPNLQFRFAIPGWTLALTFVCTLWARGQINLDTISNLANKECGLIPALLVFAAAFLGAPAIGFILSTIVTGICDFMGKGPLHGKCYDQLLKKLIELIDEKSDVTTDKTLSYIRDNYKEYTSSSFPPQKIPAALMAFIEWRIDTPAQLEWRRRQRAAFYGSWTNVLAILLGLIIGGLYDCNTQILVRWAILSLSAILIIIMLIRLAWRSAGLPDQEQEIAITQWSHDDLSKYFSEYGNGFESYKKSCTLEKKPDDLPDNVNINGIHHPKAKKN